jgi:hypothetical protein
MACSHCKDLCVEFRVSHPSELRQAIAVARDNLADGTLREIAPPKSVLSQQPFSKLVGGGAWDDFFQYYFECQYCSEQFRLHAETYHGSGGAWNVVKESELVNSRGHR